MPPRRRWTSRILFLLAALFLGAGLLWGPVVAPALVRFPTNTDETMQYRGTLTLRSDLASGAPLATPVELPLRVERWVRVVDSSFDTVVVRETVRQFVGDGKPVVEDHQFVMDRRSMKFVDDPRSWSYRRTARTDPGGTYRISFPLGTTATGVYPLFSPETASAYEIDGGGQPGQRAGLDVLGFHGAFERPAAASYRANLIANGFPAALNAAGIRATLAASGVDADAVAAALSPAGAEAWRSIIATPAALQYSYRYDGQVAVEPRTGGEVAVDATEGPAVRPPPALFEQLRTVLAAEPTSPAVTAAFAGVDRAASAGSTPVVVARYEETPASVADTVATVRDQLDKVRLVEDRLPWVALGVGAVFLLGGLLVRRRPSGHPVDRTVAVPVGTPVTDPPQDHRRAA